MKLLRITSDTEDGTFNGFLNQEITLGKKSQIALQSATFEVADRALIIDNTNDTITFQTANATGTQTVVLNHTDGVGGNPVEYNSTNLDVFFNDFTNKANCQFAITRNNQIGKQFRIKTHNDGKVEASFASSAFNNRIGELQSNISLAQVNGVNNAPTLAIPNTALISNISTTDNQVGASQYQAFTFYNFPICRGAGIFRIHLNDFERKDATHNGGFTFALSTRNPHTATTAFTNADIVAGIQCLSFEAVAANTVYSSIINGVATPNALRVDQGILAASNGMNDFIELAVSTNNVGGIGTGRNIEMNVYRRTNDADGIFGLQQLATTPYATNAQAGDDLYAYVFLHGSNNGQASCILDIPRYTADPFLENVNNPVFRENDVEPPALGVKPNPPRNRNTIHNLNLGDDSLYEWLGYNRGIQPPQTGFNIDFKADNIFGSKIIAEAFLVQLLNLPVEAYDTFRNGRENILAVIPESDEDLNVIYEPNGLYFIDMNNDFPIKVTNIRLRLLRQDYSQVRTKGLSSIVLYIKNMEE